MRSVDNIEANFAQIASLLEHVKTSSNDAPQFVCLPENCLYLRVVEGERIEGLDFAHAVWRNLADLARSRNLIIHCGSVPVRGGNQEMFNTSVVVWPDGRVEATYRKVHLFDIELDGDRPVRESDVFRHGDRTQTLQINDWSIGQSICYDLRFSDLYHQYALQGVDIILVPSSFLVKTGQAHWEILLRARAIESQAYVVAAAQAGNHESTKSKGVRETYGHSLIIDPWGKILRVGSADQPDVLSWVLDRVEIENVRRQIPMAGHRRLHLER